LRAAGRAAELGACSALDRLPVPLGALARFTGAGAAALTTSGSAAGASSAGALVADTPPGNAEAVLRNMSANMPRKLCFTGTSGARPLKSLAVHSGQLDTL